ncbi:OsmC family protein [mine drainage metagenome]|uniref:OsmC family protein n=1 Tax=mine drainage metagenome TaxID=410659 RepID=T0ZNF1_9ZZZZ
MPDPPAPAAAPVHSVRLELTGGYAFLARFPGLDATWTLDEPAPLGASTGPNASQALATATAHCLSASLLFCLRRGGIEPRRLAADARAFTGRTDEHRLRVVRIEVTLHLEVPADVDPVRLRRCREVFENYCVVTGAVRSGIPVDVRIDPPLSDPPSGTDPGSFAR